MTHFDIDRLDPRYTTILCDLWGVVHDGHHLFPGVPARLRRWTEEGRKLVLITNAPRTTEAVGRQLDRLGLSRSLYHGISTGGQAGIDALVRRDAAVGFLGTSVDRGVLEGAGLRFVADRFTALACTGLDERRPAVADYRGEFERLAARGVVFHCLNPDRVVVHGGVEELCAGSLADAYEGLGGKVCWYGKPFPAIYDHALGLAGDPPRQTVLAVGDGLLTDVLGAARFKLDCLFVSGGIHGGAPFPRDFARVHQLGAWSPIASLRTIA